MEIAADVPPGDRTDRQDRPADLALARLHQAKQGQDRHRRDG